ncbi:uncharacterized protein LOC127578550 [Pristis pectinata]|uniref:uncharacterized protein LOC127578550 n=1 Tax=Pristis pectinata TaxID=685728 RepID=UPI00223E0915|nr:uncharacterized protein LOC127578550 [Pristis pectinata]
MALKIRPPLTNPRGQETNLTQLEGLRHNVREENEKNAAIITSESPVNQQKDLEEHINFASTICTNTNPEFEPERISSSLHGSVPSEEIQVFSASINDPRGLSQCYTDAENLEAIKPEDFSKKPYSQNKEAESAQDQNPANRTGKMIPSMIQIPGNDSTGKDVADEEKEDKVGAIQIAEQSISVPSHMLADTMVKEAIEAALFEITGDEGRTFTFESQKAKALSRWCRTSQQKVTTVLNLTSKHGEPSKNPCYDDTIQKCSQLGELITETSTMHVQTKRLHIMPLRKT